MVAVRSGSVVYSRAIFAYRGLRETCKADESQIVRVKKISRSHIPMTW